MEDIKKTSKEEAIETVKKYVSAVFETNIFLPLSIGKTEYKDGLWKVTGKVLIDIPKIENEKIKSKIADLINNAVNENKRYNKKTLEGKGALSKVLDLINFCFYINSYGKICAFHPVFPDTDIPFEIPLCCNELKGKDMKDYSVRAKKFFEKGIDAKFFDFVPLYGWCKAKNDSVIFAVIVLYSTFRVFYTSYRIEIINNSIDLKTITEIEEI